MRRESLMLGLLFRLSARLCPRSQRVQPKRASLPFDEQIAPRRVKGQPGQDPTGTRGREGAGDGSMRKRIRIGLTTIAIVTAAIWSGPSPAAVKAVERVVLKSHLRDLAGLDEPAVV